MSVIPQTPRAYEGGVRPPEPAGDFPRSLSYARPPPNPGSAPDPCICTNTNCNCVDKSICQHTCMAQLPTHCTLKRYNNLLPMMVFLFDAVVFITKLPLTIYTVYTNQKWQYKAQNTCDFFFGTRQNFILPVTSTFTTFFYLNWTVLHKPYLNISVN
jgi:hypothetical protein